MSFVGDLLGLGENSGTDFRATSAPLVNPIQPGQLDQSYGQTQQGINQQQAFINALQGQNGIRNQSNVFNQQQGLANQLQGVANGTGPNPALQQLQNTTGQNVANQAALMAGQRGSNANVGLMGRQIAQQGAGIQQQAVGQGAALSAQQQLAGMNALQNQQNMMGGMANQQVGQQANALHGYNQAAQNQYGSMLGAIGQKNAADVGMQSNVNSANAQIANTTAQGQQGLLGGILGGVGTAATMLLAHGGEVPSHEDENHPRSNVGRSLKMQDGGSVPGSARVAGDSYKNDTVDAKLSPGEIVIPRHVINSADPIGNSAKFVQAIIARQGMMRRG